MRTRVLAIALLATSAIGCSRSVPAVFPSSSAASLDADEGRAARVGRAIVEEPPLPGETREGWEGLEQGDADAPDHSGHHGHGGHGHAN